jgi:hypothetical protein
VRPIARERNCVRPLMLSDHLGGSLFNLRRPRTDARTARSEGPHSKSRRCAIGASGSDGSRSIARATSPHQGRYFVAATVPEGRRGPAPDLVVDSERQHTMAVRDAASQHQRFNIGTHQAGAVVETKVRRSGVHTLKSPRARTSRSDTRASGPAGQALRRAPTVPLGICVRVLPCL